MNGYKLQDVVKIAFGMDTEVTADLKRRMFGELGTFAKMDSRSEVEWREILRDVFSGFELTLITPSRLIISFYNVINWFEVITS